MTVAQEINIRDYTVGSWTIDPVHSEVSFKVRHLMVGKVYGQFTRFEGKIVTAENPFDSTATASIELNSIDTRSPKRDDDLRSGRFFDVEEHPIMTYRSNAVRADGDSWVIEGELSLHGVTRQVPLNVELNGFMTDMYGRQRVAFSATSEINRRDFGIDISIPMDGGGMVVGDRIAITLEIEATLDQD